MATTTNHGKNLCLSCFWWSKGKCVKTKEAVALLERYSNYDGMGIPNLVGCKEAMRVAVNALKEACPELQESEED